MKRKAAILVLVVVVCISVRLLPLEVWESNNSSVLKIASSMQKAGVIPETSNLHKQIQAQKKKSHDIVPSERQARVNKIDGNDNSPLKYIRNEGKVVLPSKGEIERMSAEAAFRTYHSRDG